MPLSLNDDELRIVMSAATPIQPRDRDQFLRAVAAGPTPSRWSRWRSRYGLYGGDISTAATTRATGIVPNTITIKRNSVSLPCSNMFASPGNQTQNSSPASACRHFEAAPQP
jgi:hypothetical protein